MSLTTGQQRQLTVFVTIHVKPDDAEALASAHREVWAACAREPECLLFDVFQDPTDKGLFRFVEVWTKDRKWFEEEQMTKECKWNSSLEPCVMNCSNKRECGRLS